ncbi:MAG: YitT family protein [Oscillospiraceae bacterium]
MKSKCTLKSFAIDILCDFTGSLCYTIAIYSFIRSAGFATGGVSGLALVINYLTKLPVGMVTLALNIPVIAISYSVLGKKFLIKSLKTMVILSFCLDYIGPHLPQYQGETILAAICAGVFIGLALVIIYMRGSSTGGGDFLILSVRKKLPHLSIGNISVAIDGVILIIGGIAFQDINATLYGVVAAFIATRVLDAIMYGSSSGKMLFIVTDDGEAVSKAIFNSVKRGSTIADIRGSYAGQPRQLVLSAMSKSQVFTARKAAHGADENSFTMVTPTDNVFGLGFADPRDD